MFSVSKIVALIVVVNMMLVSAFMPSQSTSSSLSSSRSLDTSLFARTPLIAGNWKLNPATLTTATELATGVANSAKEAEGVEVAIFPPFPFLNTCKDIVKESSHIALGAQDFYWEDKGAFTGAVCLDMVESVGATYVLAGHSERRAIFKEDDYLINKKVLKILDHGLKVILCIGETQMEYEYGLNKVVCDLQLSKNLHDVTKEQMKNVVIAYEPVWAIGTGLTATPEIAQDVHSNIRKWFAKNYDAEVAENVIIQYGGSVTPETVDDLMACPDIDGALVGGASLDADKFDKIINYKK